MNYKFEMILPIVLLLVCASLFAYQMSTTGLNLDVDFRGGTQITGELPQNATQTQIQNLLAPYDAEVTASTTLQGTNAIFISVDNSVNTTDVINTLDKNGYAMSSYSIESVGATLGSSFFVQAMYVLAFAFTFMGITVFFIFRIPLPSFYVVLCGFADIFETLVVSQLFGVQLSLATFTALLLLLGYSVDTDILLTTRVFKTKEGEVPDRVRGAMKTGITMIGATFVALLALFTLAISTVITQIATVLLIGLVFDITNTWLLNAPLLRFYMDWKAKKT